MTAPLHVQAVQGMVTAPYVWVTWDRNDHLVTKYEVLRDGTLLGTVGPFVPYDPVNPAHRDWYGKDATGYVAEVLADRPAYYFRLEQTTAAQTDSGPNGLAGSTESPAGTPAALTSAVGPITGNAANSGKVLNGSSHRFAIASHAALDVFSGAWTIETWRKRGTVGTEQHFWRRGSNAPLLKFQADNTIRVRQFGVADIVGSTVALTDTAGWHHIVVTCAGPTSTPKIYLDDVDVTGAQITTPNFANGSGIVNIGGAATSANHFNGSIDEEALYATELSAARISAHYNARATAPVAAAAPFDNTWDKCAYKDTTVVAGTTYTYQVRPLVGATQVGLSAAATVRVAGDADYGVLRQVAAPSGGDDTTVLQNAINTAQTEGGIAVLQAGTYLFSKLTMDARKAVVRGQGKTSTFLRPTGAGGAGAGTSALQQITITGSQVTLTATLAQAITPGATSATFSGVTEMGVGSVLMFTAPAVGGTALDAYARGNVLKPGEEYDEANRWEANEVVSITGNVATFRYPFSQPMPTNATIVRVAEPSVGTRQRDLVFERMSVEGVSATDTTYFNNFNVAGVVGARWAEVRSRWTNSNVVTMARSFAPSFVDCDDPDHGAINTSTVQYSLNLVRTANARVIACLFGTSGSVKVVSCVAIQRAPRTVVRHCTFHWPKNYAVNEHGGGSRDWIAENNWYNLAPDTVYAGVFAGNPDFTNSGRGIIRNNRQDSGPILVYVREHGYGIRVLDNIAYGLVQNANSLATALVVWGGWDSPHEQPANWGAANLTIGRNALFGSQHDGLWLGRRSSAYFGTDTAANPDPAADGTGYLGIRDVLAFANHLHVSRTRIKIEGSDATSGRFQVRDTTGNGRPDIRPAFSPGVHWINNGDGETYGAETIAPWTEPSFAWYRAPFAAPVLDPARVASANQIDLSWSAVPEATTYVVERWRA